LAQGSYTVIVDDGTCISSIPVVLSGPNPVTGNVSTTDISCNGLADGTMTVIGAGGDSTYLYDFGAGFGASGSVTGLSAGVQTVTIQDGNGCTGTASGTVNQPSTINANSSVTDETFGLDGEIDLTVTGGVAPYSYSWTGPAGFTATSEDITGLASGLYSVTITDDNGCVITATDILVDSFIGLLENGEFSFAVYPNPSDGLFNINFNGQTAESAIVRVYDLAGRIVYLSEIDNIGNMIIDISNKANGTYILEILVDKTAQKKRIIKSR
jgi:hypothetical protein